MGFEIERFVDPSGAEEMFKCGICLEIVKDPRIIATCEHMYCSDCIIEWFQKDTSCPEDRTPIEERDIGPLPRLFRNLYSKLKIKCEFAKFGCQEIAQLSDIEGHVENCNFNKTECAKNCGFKGNRHEIEFHDCIEYLKSELQKVKISPTVSMNEDEIKQQAERLAAAEKQNRVYCDVVDTLNKELSTVKKEKDMMKKKNSDSEERIKEITEQLRKTEKDVSISDLTKMRSQCIMTTRELVRDLLITKQKLWPHFSKLKDGEASSAGNLRYTRDDGFELDEKEKMIHFIFKAVVEKQNYNDMSTHIRDKLKSEVIKEFNSWTVLVYQNYITFGAVFVPKKIIIFYVGELRFLICYRR